MATIERILADVVEREGERYTNRPEDSGGPTKFGVTRRTLERFRGRPTTAADVAALERPEALEVYRWLFVRGPGFDKLLPISPEIAEEVVDTGVNAGTARAAEFLQRCLNALNRQGRDYADIAVDGDCGPATRAALRAFLALRGGEGEAVMLAALNALQGAFYVGLAERRPKDETFLYGWLRARVMAPLAGS